MYVTLAKDSSMDTFNGHGLVGHSPQQSKEGLLGLRGVVLPLKVNFFLIWAHGSLDLRMN